MRFKVEKVEKYGQEVFQHTEMDELRKTQCLCLNCIGMEFCETAHGGYDLCKKYNIAFAVTRCPKFKEAQ
jgi:hypothetical protein